MSPAIRSIRARVPIFIGRDEDIVAGTTQECRRLNGERVRDGQCEQLLEFGYKK